MIDVSLLFILLAGIVFLGYILNAMFYRLKISNIMPLLLIGLALGPIFHFVDTSQTSIIVQISPIVTAVAIAFVLFDVGMNIRISSLRNVLLKATQFTMLTSVVVGLLLSTVLYYAEGWSVIISLIVGFALSGTSSIIIPSLFKVIKVGDDMRTTLAYQSVFSDVFSLVIPLILFNILISGSYNLAFIVGELAGFVVGSIILGIIMALLWLFVLRRFKKYSSEYSWMLTLTVVLGVYGIAQYMNFNGALSAFIFGILLTNIPDILGSISAIKKQAKSFTRPILDDLAHIKTYQKEITFFVSTFFFVYIGMLVNISGVQYIPVLLAVLMCAIMLFVRFLTSATLRGIISVQKHKRSETTINVFYIAQGLAPAIVITLLASAGMNAPGLVDVVFLVILISNAVLSTGLYLYAKDRSLETPGHRLRSAIAA